MVQVGGGARRARRERQRLVAERVARQPDRGLLRDAGNHDYQPLRRVRGAHVGGGAREAMVYASGENRGHIG